MRVWELKDGLGLAHLKRGERDRPEPGPGEVLVGLRAASLNFRDTVIVHGMYGGKQPLPLVPLSDGAGAVVAVGDGVADVAVGDRVTPCFHQAWDAGPPTLARLSAALGAGETDGVACDFRIFKAGGLVHTPDHLSDAEAACLPCAGLTAWSALVTDCPAQPGDTVLIQGTGGVAIFALQFAKALGLRTIVTSSSDEKLERAEALGADHLINYKSTPKWGRAAREFTAGRGVDHVIEVGGAGTLEQSLRAVRIGGRIASIGVLSGATTELTLPLLFMQHVTLQGITVGSRDAHKQMNRFIAQHALRPLVDAADFGFDDLPAAIRHMLSKSHMGKICVRFGG